MKNPFNLLVIYLIKNWGSEAPDLKQNAQIVQYPILGRSVNLDIIQ